MSKITIPILSYQNVASIYKLVDDLSNLNSEVLRTIVGDNLIIDFSSVIKPENQLQAYQSVI
ncbi:hypothetical protein KAR91_14640, partial [Candidatus Pacearchaeota archaeon]|nr:hypothetical protein [Candidatus Pacearchaeota archaeon]